MNQNPIAVLLDCQTTGASFQHADILELGWKVWVPQGSHSAAAKHFVIRSSGNPVAPKILRLTGISANEQISGLALADVLKQFKEDMETYQVGMVIAHFARFEKLFIERAWLQHFGCAFPLPWVCTYKLARHFVENLPSYSIRAVSGYYGYRLENEKRCRSHIEATEHICLHYLKSKPELTVSEWMDLQTRKIIKTRGQKPKYHVDESIRLNLPKSPGIYKFLDQNSSILYVGKASCLRDRVNSYFRGRTGKRSRQQELMAQVKHVVVEETVTHIEACLLENDEIKIMKPPYNIALQHKEDIPVWCDRHFAQTSPMNALDFPYGPFASQRQIRDFHLIKDLIAGVESNDLNIFGFVNDALLKAGLAFLQEQQHPILQCRSGRSLVAYGLLMLRDKWRRGEEEQEIDSEDDELETAVESFEWTAESVGRAIISTIRQFAFFYYRSKQMRDLLNATVIFRTKELGKHWRLLRIKNAQIFETKTIKTRREIKNLDLFIDSETTALDSRAFDRIRILNTELQSLVNKGGEWLIY